MNHWEVTAFNGTVDEYYCEIEEAIAKFCKEHGLCKLDIKSVIQVS